MSGIRRLGKTIKYEGKIYEESFRTSVSVSYIDKSLPSSNQQNNKLIIRYDSTNNIFLFKIGTGGVEQKGTLTTTGTTPSLKKKSSTRRNARSTNTHNRYGFSKLRKTAKTPSPPKPSKKEGAIIIVRDPSKNILLGEEGQNCLQGAHVKQYIEHPVISIGDLTARAQVTSKLYTQLTTKPTFKCPGFIVPLVTESSMKPKDPSKKMYGSHPRRKRAAAAAGGSIEYGAPKGGKESYDTSKLETAVREFIEEVGYDFNDNSRFIAKGDVEDAERKYDVYLIDVNAKETAAIAKALRDRYAKGVGEVFDLQFRNPAGLNLNTLTEDALAKI